MTKFEIGDRVKCVEGHTDDLAVRLIAGQVYTVRAIDSGQYISIDDDKPGWMVDRFELYAKAGEFVAGDVLFALYADGPLSVVNAVRASEDGQRVEFSDDLGRWWPASGYRLATPEEIAAAADKIVAEFTDPKNFDKPLRPIWKAVGDPTPHPSHNLAPRPEIPATEFDFSTIKADLKPSVPFRVHYQAVITAAEAAIKASEDIADAMERLAMRGDTRMV